MALTPLKDQFEKLKRWRTSTWEKQYNLLSQYYFAVKGDFSSTTYTEGQFLNDGSVFDSVGTLYARLATSAITSMVWKGFKKSVKIRSPKFITDKQEHREYYDYFTNTMAKLFDDSEFEISLTEGLAEWFIFGTGCVAELPNDDMFEPFIFKSYSLRGVYPIKSRNGKLDTVFCREPIPYSEAIATYGESSFSATTQALFKTGDGTETIKLVHYFAPRSKEERTNPFTGTYFAGKYGMAYKGVVFEEDTGHIVSEDFYVRCPIYLSRCYSLPNETMGRSPAMDALPTTMKLQATAEELTYSAEIFNRRPTWSTNNAVTGSGVIDLSPGVNNVFDFMGGIVNTPISPIFEASDPTPLMNMAARYEQQLQQHFYIDKLYDVNAPVRRTLGEVQMHKSLITSSLSPLFKRIFLDWIKPLLETGVERAFDAGLLGVLPEDELKQNKLVSQGLAPRIIPEEIANALRQGFDFYTIDFISPAAQIIRNDELAGLQTFLSIPLNMAQAGVFDGIDRLNVDKIMDATPDLTGVDEVFLNSLTKAQENRTRRQQAQAQNNQLDNQVKMAKANMSNAQAQSMIMGQQTNAYRSITGESTA